MHTSNALEGDAHAELYAQPEEPTPKEKTSSIEKVKQGASMTEATILLHNLPRTLERGQHAA